MNYLLIEALQAYDHYFGESLRVEYPTGSGQQHTLGEVARDLAGRLAGIFLRGADGRSL